MKRTLLDMLICPSCLPQEHGLREKVLKSSQEDIVSGSLHCKKCGAEYRIEDGIAFLDPNHSEEVVASNRYETSPVLSSYLWSHFGDLLDDEEAFIGMSGERTNRFTHTQFHYIPFLNKRESEGFVDVHPADARNRNITEGQEIRVSSPRGSIRMKARISTVLHPGSIRIAWGWGEVDPELNVNNLTDDNRRDPVTGTPSNRSFMCRIKT